MGGIYCVTVFLAVTAIQVTQQRFLENATTTTAVFGEKIALQPTINEIEGDEKAEEYAVNDQNARGTSHLQLHSEEYIICPYISPQTEEPTVDKSVDDVRNETAFEENMIVYYAINIVLLEVLGVVWALILVLGVVRGVRGCLENWGRCPNIGNFDDFL